MKNILSSLLTILKWITVPTIAISVLALQNHYNLVVGDYFYKKYGFLFMAGSINGFVAIFVIVVLIKLFWAPIEEKWYLPRLKHKDWDGFCVDWTEMNDNNPNKEKYRDIGLLQIAERKPMSEGLLFSNCLILCALPIICFINFFSNGILLIHLCTFVVSIGGIAAISQITKVERLQEIKNGSFIREMYPEEIRSPKLTTLQMVDYYYGGEWVWTNKGFASVTVLIILSAIMVYGVTRPLL